MRVAFRRLLCFSGSWGRGKCKRMALFRRFKHLAHSFFMFRTAFGIILGLVHGFAEFLKVCLITINRDAPHIARRCSE